MIEEKRKHKRITFKVAAEILVGGESICAEEIDNLSLGGCLLPVTAQWPEGTACRVEIHIGGPSSKLSIHVDGEIIRSNEKGVAVKFTHIDPDGLMHLQNILRHNTPYSENRAKEFQFKRGVF